MRGWGGGHVNVIVSADRKCQLSINDGVLRMASLASSASCWSPELAGWY